MNKSIYLAIDNVSLPYTNRVFITISEPDVRKEPVLRPSPRGSGAPDDQAAHFYGTVLFDDGKYRMWYYACYGGKNYDLSPRMAQQVALEMPFYCGDVELFQGPLCYAESDDGIDWVKPAINQFLFKGSTANNALDLPHAVVSGATVIKDPEDPDPARRYKMVYQYFPDFTDPKLPEDGKITTVAMAVSHDGLKWTVIAQPFLDQFVEHSSFIKHDGRYIVHYHSMAYWGLLANGGVPAGRTGLARLSNDFDNWPDVRAESFALPEPQGEDEPKGVSSAYDQVHLGVGAASFGNVCVGLYGMWHNADFSEFQKISGDFGLLISNDGIHFREPVKGYKFIKKEQSACDPVPGYAFHTILCQANGIVNVGDQTRIYHGRWRNAAQDEVGEYYTADVALATLPRDRWGCLSVMPGEKKGTVISCLTPVSGNESISVNADGLAGIEVSLLDGDFHPIEGYCGARPAGTDSLEAAVSFAEPLSALEGKNVYIRAELTPSEGVDPKLYAIYLKEK